jgi:hypothetical protein
MLDIATLWDNNGEHVTLVASGVFDEEMGFCARVLLDLDREPFLLHPCLDLLDDRAGVHGWRMNSSRLNRTLQSKGHFVHFPMEVLERTAYVLSLRTPGVYAKKEAFEVH